MGDYLGLFIIFLFVLAFVLWWLWDSQTSAEKEADRLARRKALASKVCPLFEEECKGLIERIRAYYSNIPFGFETNCNYHDFTNQLIYSWSNPRELASHFLYTITDYAIKTYENYRPDFSIQPSFLKSTDSSPLSDDRQRRSSNWAATRNLVYTRDQGKCRRCGSKVPLEECHIHHVLMRAEGGDDSPRNLVTLCRDCHALMGGHSSLRSIASYCISDSGTIHTPECHHALGYTPVKASLSWLKSQEKIPCGICKPERIHYQKINEWTPRIETWMKKDTERILQGLEKAINSVDSV